MLTDWPVEEPGLGQRVNRFAKKTPVPNGTVIVPALWRSGLCSSSHLLVRPRTHSGRSRRAERSEIQLTRTHFYSWTRRPSLPIITPERPSLAGSLAFLVKEGLHVIFSTAPPTVQTSNRHSLHSLTIKACLSPKSCRPPRSSRLRRCRAWTSAPVNVRCSRRP